MSRQHISLNWVCVRLRCHFMFQGFLLMEDDIWWLFIINSHYSGGSLLLIPWGPRNLVTDNGQCHWERQINIPTSTPAVTSENRSSLPPVAKINLISVFITYRSSLENSSLWNNLCCSSTFQQANTCKDYAWGACTMQYIWAMCLCNVPWNSISPGPRR